MVTPAFSVKPSFSSALSSASGATAGTTHDVSVKKTSTRHHKAALMKLNTDGARRARTPDSVLTNDVFGRVHSGDLARLAETNLVDGSDAALVLGPVDEVLNDITRFLQIPGNIAADPVCCVCPLALHQVSKDGASAVAGGSRPGEADSAVGGVGHTGVHNRPRRCWVGGAQ